MNRAPTPNSALTAQSPLESPPVPAPVPLSPRPPVPQSPRAQAEASVPAPAPVSPRAQSGAASVQDFPSQTIVTSLGGSVPTLPTPLRRGESGRSIASASGPTPGAGSESPTSVSFRKGSLQVTVPADQFARTAVPTSPRSNGSSAPGSAPTSPRGLPASQTAVSLSTVDFRGSGTVRASSLGSSDPQLAAIEAEIREWRKLFRQTYGYYPGVKDVQEVRGACCLGAHSGGIVAAGGVGLTCARPYSHGVGAHLPAGQAEEGHQKEARDVPDHPDQESNVPGQDDPVRAVGKAARLFHVVSYVRVCVVLRISLFSAEIARIHASLYDCTVSNH